MVATPAIRTDTLAIMGGATWPVDQLQERIYEVLLQRFLNTGVVSTMEEFSLSDNVRSISIRFFWCFDYPVAYRPRLIVSIRADSCQVFHQRSRCRSNGRLSHQGAVTPRSRPPVQPPADVSLWRMEEEEEDLHCKAP